MKSKRKSNENFESKSKLKRKHLILLSNHVYCSEKNNFHLNIYSAVTKIKLQLYYYFISILLNIK
jgi:hypothetical protein